LKHTLTVVRNAGLGLLSFFVDDPLFAGLLVLWTATMRALRPTISAPLEGPVLFAGFAALLVVFAYRQSTRVRKIKP
jgi:hypothetical protein